MKISIELFRALSRRALLLTGAIIGLAMIGTIAWQTSAQEQQPDNPQRGSSGSSRELRKQLPDLISAFATNDVDPAKGGSWLDNSISGIAAPAAVCQVINSQIQDGQPTNTARPFRDAVGTSCAAGSSACTSPIGGGPFRYTVHSFTNPNAVPTCITATLTATTNNFLFPVTYLNSFNPADLCANRIGDPGSSPTPGAPAVWSFNVPAFASYKILVEEVNVLPGTVNPYQLTVDTCGSGAPPTFVIDDVQKLEGQSGTVPFVFTVTKLGGTGQGGIVQFETRDGSATVANGDYVATSGTLTFGANETSKTVTVNVNGDSAVEPNESFTVNLLFNPVNGTISDSVGQGLIRNDDPAAPTPAPAPLRFEGDINRSTIGTPGTGDGDINIGDQIQYQRFLNGSDCPSASEQPRLDASPISTRGDGLLGSADGVAIDAYVRHDASTDYDPNTPGWQPTPIGEVVAIGNLGCTATSKPESESGDNGRFGYASSASARSIRVVSRTGSRGSDIMVDVEMDAQGNEAGTQYTLHFDPSVLSISNVSGVNTNPDVMFGSGIPFRTTLNVNADDVANGNIGINENFNGAGSMIMPIEAGTTRIARLRFHILDGAAGSSRVTFGDSVISGATADMNGMLLLANYDQSGAVTVASAHVSVSGRVTAADGRGLRGATVTMVGDDGVARSVTTSSFGFYTFEDVTASSYRMSVSSRQYRFASRILDVSDNLADINFVGLE